MDVASSARAVLRTVRTNTGVQLLGTIVVLAIGTVLVARSIDISTVIDAIADANAVLVAVAIGVYALSWPLRGERYRRVLAAMDRPLGVGFLTATVFLSQAANLIVPARAGDGVRAYLLNDRRNVPYTLGVASLAVERLFDLVAILALGVAAFLAVLFSGTSIATTELPQVGLAGATAVGTIAVGVSAVTVGLVRSDRPIAAAIRTRVSVGPISRIVDPAIAFAQNVGRVAANRRAMANIGAWSLVVWILDVITAIVVLAALTGGGPSVWLLIVVGTFAVSVGNLAKVLPLSQGGIGLYEAAFTGLVVAVSPIAASTALAAAILDHAIKNAVTLVGGSAIALSWNVSTATIDGNRPADDPEPADI